MRFLFKEFRLVSCRFTLLSEEVGTRLPAIKGGIFDDHCFKEIVSRYFCRMKDKKCEGCSLNLACPYSYMYKNIQIWKGQRFSSVAPLTWKPPLEKKTVYMKGEKIYYSLILVGNASIYLEKMIDVFRDYLLKKEHVFGKFTLKEAASENPFTGETKVVYGSETGFNSKNTINILGEEIGSWSKKIKKANCFSLTFLTPTCIKYKNEYVVDPYFYFFVKELVLRIQTLYYFYHGSRELNMEYQDYLRRAEDVLKISDHSRFIPADSSMRTNDEGPGLLGKVKYAGRVQEFIPLIKLGEYVHVGEKAVLGFGRYRIKF